MSLCKLKNILDDLIQNYNAIALRADLASGTVALEELEELSSLAKENNISLTVKIGGCDATNDIFQLKNICANSIIIPMVETPYALKKFITNCKKIYSEDEIMSLNLYPNIETITAYNNFDEIFAVDEAKYIKGIVLGRDDMAGSMGLTREDINSDRILEIAKNLQNKIYALGKEFILGGEIRPKAISFINKLDCPLSRCETRMIVFSGENFIDNALEDKILKALEFEILWLENKKNKTQYDISRIEKLKSNLPNRIY